MVERTLTDAGCLYVADRNTGAPVAKAEWRCGPTESSNRPGKTDANGMATLRMNARGVQRRRRAAGQCVDAGATRATTQRW